MSQQTMPALRLSRRTQVALCRAGKKAKAATVGETKRAMDLFLKDKPALLEATWLCLKRGLIQQLIAAEARELMMRGEEDGGT